MRLWYLLHRRPAKAQASLRIRAVSPEPSLFAHMKYGSRQRIWPNIRHLRQAPLEGCPCAFEEWVYWGRKSTINSSAGSFEPEQDKTNRMTCAPSKESDQPGTLPSLIRVSAVRLKKVGFLVTHKQHSEHSEQTCWMSRLIRVFTGGTGHFVGFVILRSLSDSSKEEIMPLKPLTKSLTSKGRKTSNFCQNVSSGESQLTGTVLLLYEPRHEKTCLRGFRPGKTQTGLLSYRD